MISLISFCFFILFCFVVCFFFWLKFKRESFFITNFINYQTVLLYYMDIAYLIIYKDQIFIYSLEAMKVPDNLVEKAVKDFCKLTEKFMGDKLFKVFREIYTLTSLQRRLTQYFLDRYDEDAIRENALNNLTNPKE